MNTKQVPASSIGWNQYAKLALTIRATQESQLTSDDVWRQLKLAGVEGPVEPRAMGPIMKWGTKQGLISSTSYTSAPAKQIRKNHKRPLAVYISLVTGQPAPEWPLVSVPESIL